MFALILSFLFIVYRTVVDNKKRSHAIFYKLSMLPFLVVASHILMLLTGKTFNPEGGWWILHTLLIIAPILSIILFAIGFINKKIKGIENKV